MKPKTDSPRQKLLRFVETGNLRNLAERQLDEETTDLLVTVVYRYCLPRRLRRPSGRPQGGRE